MGLPPVCAAVLAPRHSTDASPACLASLSGKRCVPVAPCAKKRRERMWASWLANPEGDLTDRIASRYQFLSASYVCRYGSKPKMKNRSAIMAGALLAAAYIGPAAMAQPACVGAGASVPAGANTTDRSAPFFIDPTGMDLNTSPPTRDPSNPRYPHATELSNGMLPPGGAEGNFIIGPTHKAAPETVAQDNVPHGTIHSFIISSKDSVVYNPGMIRDDPANCRNGSIYASHHAPGDPSDLIVTTSHPGNWARTIDVYVPAQYVPGTRGEVFPLQGRIYATEAGERLSAYHHWRPFHLCCEAGWTPWRRILPSPWRSGGNIIGKYGAHRSAHQGRAVWA
jgi:hypothetical protein